MATCNSIPDFLIRSSVIYAFTNETYMLDSLTCQGTIQQTLIQMDSLNMHVIKPQGLPIITEDVRTPLPHHPTIVVPVQ